MTRATPRPAAAGFTLVELMVVIIIVGILATVAVFGARRNTAEIQIDTAAGSFRWAVANARQRALATHTAQFVEISKANGFRVCTAKTDLSACLASAADGGVVETSSWVQVGDQVVLDKYALATNISGETGATAFGSTTVRVLAKANGVIDSDLASATTDEGFTIYLRSWDSSKERKIYLFPLTGATRVADKW